MAKAKKIKTQKKKTSGILKFLEIIVVVGSVAALAIKMFKGKSAK